jgi:vacuolar protein sorting-associated protein 35
LLIFRDDILTPSVSKQIVILLNKPLELKNIISVLSLQHYPTVMGFLGYNTRKRVSIDIAKSSIQNQTRISTADHVNRLFEFISPIIRDQEDQPPVPDIDMEDFEEEQHLVGALVHLFSSDLKELSAVLFF